MFWKKNKWKTLNLRGDIQPLLRDQCYHSPKQLKQIYSFLGNYNKTLVDLLITNKSLEEIAQLLPNRGGRHKIDGKPGYGIRLEQLKYNIGHGLRWEIRGIVHQFGIGARCPHCGKEL